MDVRETTAQRVKLRTRLPALLKLALQAAQYVVEREPALPGDTHVPAHTAHPLEALSLQCWPPLRTNGPVGAALPIDKVKCAISGAGLIRHAPHVALGALLLRLRLGALRCLRVELREDAHDPSSNLVVDDGLVVFADDIDTEFLRGPGP